VSKLVFGLCYLACWLIAFAAWVTHVVTCIKTGTYVLLVIGALVFPIGVIHGWAIWLGLCN